MNAKQTGMSLRAFADQEGITYRQAAYLAKRGRIMGACKSHSGDWLVFPPAKLTEPLQKRRTWRDREVTASASAASAFGTSPHGLAMVDRRAAVNGASAHSQQVQGGSHAHSTGEASDTAGQDFARTGRADRSASFQADELIEGGRVTSTAAVSQRLPYHYLELSEEQCSYVAFALTCHIEELEASKEASHPEVLNALRHLNAARRILEERPA